MTISMWFLFLSCLFFQPSESGHTAGHSDCGSDGGQDADERLDDDAPDGLLLFHVHNVFCVCFSCSVLLDS